MEPSKLNINQFKYQKQMEGLLKEGLKMPELHSPCGMEAYRYVFSNGDNRNHKPVLVLNPTRSLPDELKFSGYALSCFDNEDKAVSRYRKLCKTRKKISLVLGDALSFGHLNDTDGMISNVDLDTRHFDFYEFENCDLSNTFSIKRILI